MAPKGMNGSIEELKAQNNGVDRTPSAVITKKRPARGRNRAYSALTQGLALTGLEKNQTMDTTSHHPGINFSRPINGVPHEGQPHGDNTVGGKDTTMQFEKAFFKNNVVLGNGYYDKNALNGFHDFTSGKPQPTRIISSVGSGSLLSRPGTPRRASIAYLPEIDHQLMPHRVKLAGVQCLLITGRTIEILAPFINDSKPVADLSVFENIAIDLDFANAMPDFLRLTLTHISDLVTGAIVLTGVGSRTIREVGQDAKSIETILTHHKEVAHLE